jgi:hypothetical protein
MDDMKCTEFWFNLKQWITYILNYYNTYIVNQTQSINFGYKFL